MRWRVQLGINSTSDVCNALFLFSKAILFPLEQFRLCLNSASPPFCLF